MPDRELLEQRMRRGFRRDLVAPTARLLSKRGRNRAGSLSLLVRRALCPTTSAAALNALRSSQSRVRQNTLPTRAPAANAVGAASRSAVAGQHLRMKFVARAVIAEIVVPSGNLTTSTSCLLGRDSGSTRGQTLATIRAQLLGLDLSRDGL